MTLQSRRRWISKLSLSSSLPALQSLPPITQTTAPLFRRWRGDSTGATKLPPTTDWMTYPSLTAKNKMTSRLLSWPIRRSAIKIHYKLKSTCSEPTSKSTPVRKTSDGSFYKFGTTNCQNTRSLKSSTFILTKSWNPSSSKFFQIAVLPTAA